jgi:hypothetical protein
VCWIVPRGEITADFEVVFVGSKKAEVDQGQQRDQLERKSTRAGFDLMVQATLWQNCQ